MKAAQYGEHWTWRLVLASICTLLLAAAPPTPPISDWSKIETVVVTAQLPGPVLWHVQQGSSEVWILATVAPVPANLSWDSRTVAKLLIGARLLLLPPRGEVGVFEGAWFVLTGLDTLQQPDGVTLESTLADPLKSRFVAARIANHQDADRYEKYLPAVAAVILESDYWKANNMNFNGPQKTVEALARRASVPVRAAATYPAMDVNRDVPKMSAPAQRACLEDALNDIAIESVHVGAAAQAWAMGDLAGIKANYSEIGLDACLQQSRAYSVLRDREAGDIVNAIADALKNPGNSVAVIPMGIWLRKGGVLERLEAAGLTVSGPEG
jgi:hypothetical protein